MFSGRSSVGWRIRCCVGPNRSSHATQTTERHPTTLNKNDVVMMAFSRLLFSYTAFSILAFMSLVLRRPLRVLVFFSGFPVFAVFLKFFSFWAFLAALGFFPRFRFWRFPVPVGASRYFLPFSAFYGFLFAFLFLSSEAHILSGAATLRF